MSKLAILGAGGHGRVVADAAEASSQWSDISFFDDSWPTHNTNGPWPIVGHLESLQSRLVDFDGIIVAIGANRIRLNYSQILENNGGRLATVIHPRATISRHASVERGTVVFAGAVINVGARIGMACIINTGSTIDHDCQLADGVHISPGANLAGAVKIGQCTWIGASAGVRQQITIGANVVVGVGSVVVSNQPDGITTVGNPAKALNRT